MDRKKELCFLHTTLARLQGTATALMESQSPQRRSIVFRVYHNGQEKNCASWTLLHTTLARLHGTATALTESRSPQRRGPVIRIWHARVYLTNPKYITRHVPFFKTTGNWSDVTVIHLGENDYLTISPQTAAPMSSIGEPDWVTERQVIKLNIIRN